MLPRGPIEPIVFAEQDPGPPAPGGPVLFSCPALDAPLVLGPDERYHFTEEQMVAEAARRHLQLIEVMRPPQLDDEET